MEELTTTHYLLLGWFAFCALFVIFWKRFKVNFYDADTPRKRKKYMTLPATIKGTSDALHHIARETESPMLLIVFDKQENRLVTIGSGDEFELIRHISEATDECTDTDEFFQILAKHYAAKFQSK